MEYNRIKGKEALLISLALIVLSSFNLHADPRWWWHDGLIPFGGAGVTIADVDIDVDSSYTGNARGDFFVTWIVPARGPMGGAVWLTASFDGGCSFCDP